MGISYAVVALWLAVWNNQKSFMNATNLSVDSMTFKNIFRMLGKFQRTKMVLVFLGQSFCTMLSYFSSNLLVLLLASVIATFE